MDSDRPSSPDQLELEPTTPRHKEAAAASSVYRDSHGEWVDIPLAVKLLHMVDPLVVRAMVEPHSSSLLHVPAAAVAKGGPWSLAKEGSAHQSSGYLAVMRGVFSSTEQGAEQKDSLADLAVRLQLSLLQEGLTDASALEASDGSTGLDVSRQVRPGGLHTGGVGC